MRRTATLASVSLVLGLSACGSDDDDKAAAPPAAETTTQAAASGEPIKVGNITALAGFGGIFESFHEALKAKIDHVNANGGVDGRPIELTVIDDTGDPGKNAAAARKLVQDEGAVAIVGEASPAAAASQSYLAKQNVPAVAGWANDWAWGAENMFPIVSSADLPEACAGWASEFAKQQGSASVAIVGLDYPGGHIHLPCFEAKAKELGIDVPLKPVYASLTQADFRPIMRRILDAKAEDIIVDIGADALIKMVEAGEQLGFKGRIITTGSLTPASIAGLGASKDAIAGRVFGPAFAIYPKVVDGKLSTDGLADETAAEVDAFSASIPKEHMIDPFALSGWASGVILVEALKSAGDDPAKLMAYMQENTHDAKKLLPEWSYKESPHLPSRCVVWFGYQEDGSFGPVDGSGTEFTCSTYIDASKES